MSHNSNANGHANGQANGNHAQPRKICIIGAGLSGLGYLQALLDLPPEARQDWEIDCYESRDAPGGIWYPQPKAPSPPEIPETPAYDDLETITLATGSKSRGGLRVCAVLTTT